VFKYLTILASLLLLSACTQKFNDVNATLDEALFGAEDVALTSDKIAELPYASSFVRINDGAQLFMVLAFAEPNPATGIMQLKWLSSDKAMIVTENGRVVKTLGLAQANLQSIEPSTKTAPAFAELLQKQMSRNASYSWKTTNHYLYHYHADITPIISTSEFISTPLWQKPTKLVYETVNIKSLDTSFTNRYWVDEQGDVVKSVQYLGPKLGKIEMTILKPFSL
jgi:hypothetical protein